MNLKSIDNIKRRKESYKPIVRYKKSFLHAIDGLTYAIKNEHNMIIIVIAIILTILLGFLLRINIYEWLFIIVACASVLGVEMINTSLEAVVDIITLKDNQLAKIAKDCTSAATLVFSIMALIGGIIIFLPKIINIFK